MYQEIQALAVLEFALRQVGVDPNGYAIVGVSTYVGEDDRLFLRKEADGDWTVYFIERGSKTKVSRFQSGYDATNFFFWTLTEQPTYWRYRTQWEATQSP